MSSWGHDFRPDYLRLGGVAEQLGHPTVVALTATASPPVRDEIVASLRLPDEATGKRPQRHLGASGVRKPAAGVSSLDRARAAGHGTSVNRLVWPGAANRLVSCSDDRSLGVWQLTMSDEQ